MVLFLLKYKEQFIVDSHKSKPFFTIKFIILLIMASTQLFSDNFYLAIQHIKPNENNINFMRSFSLTAFNSN